MSVRANGLSDRFSLVLVLWHQVSFSSTNLISSFLDEMITWFVIYYIAVELLLKIAANLSLVKILSPSP
jgi:hypothetical protein